MSRMDNPIKIPEDQILTRSEGSGREFFDEELALAQLLIDDIVFANCRDTVFQGEPQGHTTVLYVNCNDIFAWACADAENLPHDEIRPLYEMHTKDPVWGSAKWCCIRRNQKPQRPVEKAMKRARSWDSTMEALPNNHMDKEVQGIFRAVAAKMKRDG